MEMIIELVGRGNRHFDLQRVNAERISIGRAFDNDIILSDPHVCAHHAVLETNAEGAIQIRDLGSVNGTRSSDRQTISDGHTLQSGDEFVVGKTRIRIYRPDHAVAPSIRLTRIENLALLADSPAFAVGVFVLTLLFSLFFHYSSSFKEFNLGRELITVIGMLLAVSLWPAGWAMFARARKHEARFAAQLSATLCFMVVVTLLQKSVHWLAYHWGTSPGLAAIGNLIYVLLLLLLIWFHYYLSIFQTAKQRWVYAASFTGLLAGFAYLASSLDADRFEVRPDYSASLYPPALTLSTTQPVNDYLKQAEAVFAKSAAMIDKEK